MRPLGFAKSSAAPDPFWANVSYLMHADAMPLVDAKGNKTFTQIGTAGVSTARSKFGGASLNLPASTDAYTVQPTPAAIAGQFTFEAWINVVSPTANNLVIGTIVQVNDANVDRFALYTDGSGKLSFFVTYAALVLVGVSALNANQWYHVAITRDASNIIRMFQDGVVIATSGAFANTLVSNTTTIGAVLGIPGCPWIDDLRMTLGVCRYNANFTPPTAAFPNG